MSRIQVQEKGFKNDKGEQIDYRRLVVSSKLHPEVKAEIRLLDAEYALLQSIALLDGDETPSKPISK